MLLSLSHQRLLAYLGENFDEKVKKWKFSIEETMKSSVVRIAYKTFYYVIIMVL